MNKKKILFLILIIVTLIFFLVYRRQKERVVKNDILIYENNSTTATATAEKIKKTKPEIINKETAPPVDISPEIYKLPEKKKDESEILLF